MGKLSEMVISNPLRHLCNGTTHTIQPSTRTLAGYAQASDPSLENLKTYLCLNASSAKRQEYFKADCKEYKDYLTLKREGHELLVIETSLLEDPNDY